MTSSGRIGLHPGIRVRGAPTGVRVASLVLAASLAARPGALAAQEAPGAPAIDLAGVVIDALTDRPLPGASIGLEGSPVEVGSGDDGRFLLADVPTGPVLVRASRFGYEDLLVPVTVRAGMEPVTLRLQPRPLTLEGLEVTGRDEVDLSGAVVDARTGAGLPFARLTLGERRARPADERGAFRLEDVRTGGYLLLVERLGYESLYVPLTVSGSMEPLLLSLEPDSLLMAGMREMRGRLDSRRNGYGFGPVRAYDEARLQRSAAFDALQFLSDDAFLRIEPCPPSRGGQSCVMVRGRPASVRVFIDEMPVPCGLSVLGTYRPEDLYMVEVYDNGQQIRAYTLEYMERTGRRPRTPIPANLLPPAMGC